MESVPNRIYFSSHHFISVAYNFKKLLYLIMSPGDFPTAQSIYILTQVTSSIVLPGWSILEEMILRIALAEGPILQ